MRKKLQIVADLNESETSVYFLQRPSTLFSSNPVQDNILYLEVTSVDSLAENSLYTLSTSRAITKYSDMVEKYSNSPQQINYIMEVLKTSRDHIIKLQLASSFELTKLIDMIINGVKTKNLGIICSNNKESPGFYYATIFSVLGSQKALSRHSSEESGARLILNAVHIADTPSGQLDAAGTAVPLSCNCGCLSLGHRVSALRLESADLVQRLHSLCSDAITHLDHVACIKAYADPAVLSSAGPRTDTLHEHTSDATCTFLSQVLEKACGGLRMPDHLETVSCDSCGDFFALELDRSLALTVGAISESRLPQLLNATGTWLGVLLCLEEQDRCDHTDRLLLLMRLFSGAIRCLDTVLGIAAAATGIPQGSDPAMSASERAAAAKAACSLVNEVLQCGLLRQLASGKLLKVLCSPAMGAAAAAKAVAAERSGTRDGSAAEAEVEAEPKPKPESVAEPKPAEADAEAGEILRIQSRLALMPILFNRVALHVTLCVRELASAAISAGHSSDDGLSEGSSDCCDPMRKPRVTFFSGVSLCSRRLEELAVSSCKLCLASDSLEHLLTLSDLVMGSVEESQVAALLQEAMEG